MTCFAKRFEKRYAQLENVLDREISSAAARLLYGIRYEERAHGWVAHIRRPGGFVIMRKGIINGTLHEGEEFMQLSRAA